MTDLTSDECRDLADLCEPTFKALENIAHAWVLATGSGTNGLPDVQAWLKLDAPIALRVHAAVLRESENAERRLRKDIRKMAKASEGHVDVDAIIQRVRKEES